MPLLILFFIAFWIAAIIFMPLATIWAVNLLFTLAIPYTFKTWLAVVVLGLFIRAVPPQKKS